MKFLSYTISSSNPTYGNRYTFNIKKISSIENGDIANDSFISTTVHVGTHIDLPFHFFENGQTIEDFPSQFWFFNKPLFIEIKPQNLIIYDEIIKHLNNYNDENYDILIIKTGSCYFRETDQYSLYNYGFSADLYYYLIDKFPKIRVFGFDSISISSFQNRMEGRKAHKTFLNPEKPILLLEDMDLRDISTLNKIIVAPLRIANCDGLPCTVFGE